MPKPKKSIKIEDLKKQINARILHTPDSMKSERSALGALLGSILSDANQYKGFGYLYAHDMKESMNGTSVGINNGPDAPLLPHADYNQRFENTDNTRVYYF